MLTYYDREEGRLYFDTVEITDYVKNQLGINEVTGDYESIKAFKWVSTGSGFVGFKRSSIYYVLVEIDEYIENNEYHFNIKPKAPIQIGIEMNPYDLYIEKVYGCFDKNKIVICCTTDLDENIFLLWDCKTNSEIRNYSTKGQYNYIQGQGSVSGYVLNENNYANMDSVLKNYFFDTDFNKYFHEDLISNGFKMSQNEEELLCKGLVVLKVTYLDCQTANNLISNSETITQENIYIERIKFQLNGNNILHMYALEFDTLQVILEYL